jgi:hypothetical protein
MHTYTRTYAIGFYMQHMGRKDKITPATAGVFTEDAGRILNNIL